MAVRGALRCEITTVLTGTDVVDLFQEALGKKRWLKEGLANASSWKLVPPPAGAKAAAEWVRNSREERTHAIKPGGYQDGFGAAFYFGSVIAIDVETGETGQTIAQLFTAVLKMNENGKVNPIAAKTIRNQFDRVVSAIEKRDPTATSRHYSHA